MTKLDCQPIAARESPKVSGFLGLKLNVEDTTSESNTPHHADSSPLCAGLNLELDVSASAFAPNHHWAPPYPSGMKTNQSTVDGEITEADEKPGRPDTDPTGTDSSDSEPVVQEKAQENAPPKKSFTLPSSLAWIPANSSWSKLKPVIRCSLAAWVSLVLMVISAVSRPLGQASTTYRRALSLY